MTTQELSTAVIALTTIGLIYLLRDLLDEAADEARGPWRQGDKPRRPRAPATWAPHELCASLTFLSLAVFFGLFFGGR